MKLLWIALAVGVLSVVALDLYIRFAPVPYARFESAMPRAPGDYPETGGFQAARQPSDPGAAMEALDRIIRATARTHRVSGSVEDGRATYVTRSLVWGFPDVTVLWRSGDTVQIRGHLVFGRSDLGVNKARIAGWLDEAGL